MSPGWSRPIPTCASWSANGRSSRGARRPRAWPELRATFEAAFPEAMFEQGPPDAASIERAARAAGLDLEAARAFAASDEVSFELARNAGFAERLGFSGTPSWVIGDRVLEGAVEAIVALGGGSVIDAAKVLAAASGDFDRVRRFLQAGMGADTLGRTPIIAVPTTSGTGSEVSRPAAAGPMSSPVVTSSCTGPTLTAAGRRLSATASIPTRL